MRKNCFSLNIFACLTLFLLFIACNNKSETISEESIFAEFYSGDVLVTISRGAAIETKNSTNDIDYYTVSGQLNKTEYSIFVECSQEESGFFLNKVYSQEGIWLFTDIIFEGRLVGREFSDLENHDNDDIITKASRRKDERYIDCVHRIHAKMKGRLENNYPVTCDILSFCGAISAVCAIVECNEYGSDH